MCVVRACVCLVYGFIISRDSVGDGIFSLMQISTIMEQHRLVRICDFDSTIEFTWQKLVKMPNLNFIFNFLERLLTFDHLGVFSGPLTSQMGPPSNFQ